MRTAWLVLGLMAIAPVLPAAEPSPPDTAPAEPPKPYVEPETGIAFPGRLGVLTRGDVHHYENAALGVSVAYACDEPARVVVDIYVYDLGQQDIGTGVESEVVKRHFAAVQRDLYTMEKMGRYREVKKLSEETVSVQVGEEPLALLHAIFEFTNVPPPGSDAPERPAKSHILLTGFKDKFLKVRFTYHPAQEVEGDKAFADFLPRMGRMLSSAGAAPPSEPETEESPSEPKAPSEEPETTPSPAAAEAARGLRPTIL